MNIHEHQAKAVLKEFGVPVLRGQVAFTPDEAEAAAPAEEAAPEPEPAAPADKPESGE